MSDNAMGSYSDPNITPPMGQAVPLGLQHVLAMFASNVTPSVIVAGAAGLQFGGAEQVYLIQMAMLFAGIATRNGVGPVALHLYEPPAILPAQLDLDSAVALTQNAGRRGPVGCELGVTHGRQGAPSRRTATEE